MKVSRKDGSIGDFLFEDAKGKEAFWNTASLILAYAVKRLYPTAKRAVGSAVTEGFYYDFEFDTEFNTVQLQALEEEMRKIVKESFSLLHYDLSKEEAITLMQQKNESYKLELIHDLSEDLKLSFYRYGEYIDFGMDSYVSNTSFIKAFKLTAIAGAYWKGNEKNKMLTRIYGIAFPREDDLEKYLERIEEVKRRDHRKLGKDLGLFAIMEEAPGFPFFLPKGMLLKNLLIDYWRKLHIREGYLEISTPMMLNRQLWETSGHWNHYRENMYTSIIDGTEFVIKPMNCPGGILVYQMQPHSYKELPIRIGELGLVHRHEKSGSLHGLMRVRCFTQDDAHIFMTENQITAEIKSVICLIDEVYKKFGFKYHIALSTRPKDSIGSEEDWNLATIGLKKALDDLNLAYIIHEGDGAFYGPKIDFHLEDSIGRTWQCGTIQLDFQLPLRFGVEYIGTDGEKHRPIMIHRVVYGSIERFIGILIEHYAGKFPLWLSPVQVKILPLSDLFIKYADSVMQKLNQVGIRCEIDARTEKIGYKIREAQLDKVPYMVIVGEKEKSSNQISIRKRDEGDLGIMSIEIFIQNLQKELLNMDK